MMFAQNFVKFTIWGCLLSFVFSLNFHAEYFFPYSKDCVQGYMICNAGLHSLCYIKLSCLWLMNLHSRPIHYSYKWYWFSQWCMADVAHTFLLSLFGNWKFCAREMNICEYVLLFIIFWGVGWGMGLWAEQKSRECVIKGSVYVWVGKGQLF